MDYKTNAQKDFTPFLDLSVKERSDSLSQERLSFDSPVAML